MKRYLWTGVAILYIGLEASDNPFDLKTNLKNLDEEQSRLISELRESSSSDEFLLDVEIDTEAEKTDSMAISDQNASLSQERAETIPPEKTEEMQTDAKASESHETVMAEEQKKAEEARLKALEEERIAVEKYEAERLRKKRAEQAKQDSDPKEAQTTSNEALKAETVPEQSLDIEKAMEQAKKEVEKPQMKKDTVSAPKSTEGQAGPDDGNPTPEEKEAKDTADRLYREAIKEVDAE